MKSVEQIRIYEPVSAHLAFSSSKAPVSFAPSGELGFRLRKNLTRISEELPYSREYILGQINESFGSERTWSNFPRFHGDICGRWILAQSVTHADGAPDYLSNLVGEVCAMQNDDGSFGMIQDDGGLNMHKAYGNGWMLKGLCTYADLFSCKKARAAAERLGEHYLTIFNRWSDSGVREGDTRFYAVSVSCYFHAMDGVVDLYKLTGDERYLDLAEKFIPHFASLDEADHSHMYLTIRRGMLNYYRLVGDQAGIRTLSRELQRVYDQYVLESGGMPECFRAAVGDHRMDEGCSLFDWLLLCLGVHEATGDDCWLEYAQLNLENQIYYNQTYNSGFGSYELDKPYLQYGKEAPWCCSLYGPFGLAGCAGASVVQEGSTLVLRLMMEGQFTFAGGDAVNIVRDRNRLVIDFSKAPRVDSLKLFFPHWMNESAQSEWKTQEVPAGRMLVVDLDFQLWMSQTGRAPRRCQSSEGSVLFCGPWMMVHRFKNCVPKFLCDEDGQLPLIEMEYLFGLGGYGEDFRLVMPSDLKMDLQDVFSGPGEESGTLYLYPLKSKESPDSSVAHVCCSV